MTDEQEGSALIDDLADNWLEAEKVTGGRVAFRMRDVSRIEEVGLMGGTRIVYPNGDSFEVLMSYDDVVAAREIITGGDTLRPVPDENHG